MLYQWTKAPLLALVCGLCLSPLPGANAQGVVETFSVNVPRGVSTRPLGDIPPDAQEAQPAPQATQQVEIASVRVPPLEDAAQAALPDMPPATPVPGNVRIALLLPLRSATLGRAAGAVRAGFFAAYERQRQGIEVTLVETGDAPQDVVAGYRRASATHDIVVA